MYPLLFSTAAICAAVQGQWTCLVGRETGIEVGDAALKVLSPVCLSTSSSIVCRMKDDMTKRAICLCLGIVGLAGFGYKRRVVVRLLSR